MRLSLQPAFFPPALTFVSIRSFPHIDEHLESPTHWSDEESDIEFARSLEHGTRDAVVTFDRSGRVHSWNSSMASLSGRSFSAADDVVVGKVFPFLAYGEEVGLLHDALEGRMTTIHSVRVRRHEWSDDEVWLDLTVTPMRADDGQIVGAKVVATDVTRRRRS